MRCTAEQVVVGAGMEYLLSLLAPLLPGKTAVENPGYQRAKQVLENNGVACCCCLWMRTAFLLRHCPARARRCAMSRPATSSPRA